MSPAGPPDPADAGFDLAFSRHAEGIVRIIEASAAVQRRYQFFVWVQSHLQHMLPHTLLVCGAWHRTSKDLVFEAFNNVPITQETLAALCQPRSALMRELQQEWVDGGGGSKVVDVAGLAARVPAAQLMALHGAGLQEFLLHAVSRPYRSSELETLFLLARPSQPWQPVHRSCLDLLIPHLHTTYMRVQVTERRLGTSPLAAGPAVAAPPPDKGQTLTERERQILSWVREGKHNPEVAELLGISPLTVKNHVQKILRKLGAVNRAQAVARAMSRQLL